MDSRAAYIMPLVNIISKVVTSQPVEVKNEAMEITDILSANTIEQVDVNNTLNAQTNLEEKSGESLFNLPGDVSNCNPICAIEAKSNIFKIAIFFLILFNIGLVFYLIFRRRKNVKNFKKSKKQYERIRNKEQNVKEHLICHKGPKKAKNDNKGHPGYTSEMDDDDLLDLIDKETNINGFPLYQNLDEKPMMKEMPNKS